jgi:hypothetical protein
MRARLYIRPAAVLLFDWAALAQERYRYVIATLLTLSFVSSSLARATVEARRRVAAISTRFWRNRFGTDPAILGREIRINDEPYSVVAVMPDVIPTVTTIYPPYNGWTQMLDIPGHPASRVQDIPSVQFGVVDAHFLRTLGVPLIRGRDFSESDGPTDPPVALISQELSRRYFPAMDPVGRFQR